MRKHEYVTLLLIAMLTACASEPENQAKSFDSELYDGRPVETFNADAAPLTEVEAIKRGDYALRQNNSDLALYEYIRSLEFPNSKYSDKTLYTIGRIHQSRGNFQLAERAYLLALENNPDNVKVLEQLGSNYSKQRKVDEGRSYFLRAINADQVRLSSRKSLNDDSSVTDIDALSSDNSSPALAYIGLGVLDDVKAQHDTAQALYAQALKIDPKSFKALMNMGYSYYMSGNYGDASRFTLAALEQDPNNDKALNNLALIHLAKGEAQRALNVFMRRMDPPEALNNVGYFLMLQGKPEEAIPYLQQAIDKKPSYYKLANENLERALAEVRAKAPLDQETSSQ
ncbi:tetratricopeptide repeat protein [Vibrio ziniensis]|uniref:Tetratricopeptide repeat protein n=1 Tax=Vibrio ziniensis TaxID=2711221 RepID=A0A6G7CFV7_9VIBR|nr:tetratricopeptide repeat protein [Vibrio ziniensis]QIH40982.1 tetratricopeptide repeat protein [Vibrio ziniensis]